MVNHLRTPFTIVDRHTAPRGFEAAFRPARPGPEQKLVQSFLSEEPFSPRHGFNVTIFCEPRIESGFPDLVVVFWDATVTQRWVPARADLRKQDIKLLHYLYQTGPLSSEELPNRFSVPIGRSLARLEAADLICSVRGRWRAQPLNKTFAVRRIVAIEAKISEWARALRQAFQNTWFASDSYVLLPEKKSSGKIRAAARPLGVKLCAPGQPLRCKQRISRGCLPRSYVSWLFNEWSWRLAHL